MATRTERRKAKTEETILKATITLVDRYGYEAVTMEQIADEADIAKGTLYNYYKDKQAVVSGYVMASMKRRYEEWRLKAFKQSGTKHRFASLITSMLEGVQRRPLITEQFLLTQMEMMIDMTSAEEQGCTTAMIINEIIAEGKATGELNEAVPDSVISEMFMFVFIQCAKVMIKVGSIDPSDVTEQYIDIFIKGVEA